MVHATRWWPGLVCAPSRWGYHWRKRPYGTRDGVIPYRVFLAYLSGLGLALALERVNLTRAVSTVLAGEGAGDAIDRDLEEAFG